jgi:hypothetical protein
MPDKDLPAMRFPSPSNELIQQARADAPPGKLWGWIQVLPQTIKQCLSRWQIEWTGESLKHGTHPDDAGISSQTRCLREAGRS